MYIDSFIIWRYICIKKENVKTPQTNSSKNEWEILAMQTVMRLIKPKEEKGNR